MQQDRRTLDVWHQGLHLQSCRQFSASIEVLPILNPGGNPQQDRHTLDVLHQGLCLPSCRQLLASKGALPI
jgi:hypothetical protein